MPFAGTVRARVIALCAGLLISGCATTVDGTARYSPSPSSMAPVVQIMPTDEEIRAAVGNELQQNPPPRVGGIEVLPDGIRTDKDAAPIECLGAVSPRMHIVYEKGPVRDAAVQDYWNYDLDVAASKATAAAIKFASTADAERLFATFVQQWQHCQGTTLTMFTWDSSKTQLYHQVTDVQVRGPLLSATILSWDNHHTPQFPVERAVGVESDVIVDVQVAVRPHLQTGSRATDLARTMLRKVAGSS
ncbi:hypothetical protein A5645_01615 [Mycobacterium asiaticum]|uniref:sensor domain-containing protein n=1 Tax=Mycobacterium asiaticum TaxID=1790 RepID=UPI0007EF8112|nr:sensor domain-containing protein [Mycobacterium asiaticum]OBK94281.1 hypothetical protein A5645_01615 [Mycobacterium asiaticum]